MPITASPFCRLDAPRDPELIPLGLKGGRWDLLVALAGNPNTGKSTVFNALTGMRQHTGNWPGKTVTRAEGVVAYEGRRIRIVDLPGTYSLQAASADEEVARDFLLLASPHVSVVVVDATLLERNLNLVLQVLEITDRVVLCLNLTDEARRKGVEVDGEALSRRLGVPVVSTVARERLGIQALLKTIVAVGEGEAPTRPRRVEVLPGELEEGVGRLLPVLAQASPGLPNARWVALRLLTGDESVISAMRRGELGTGDPEEVLRLAADLRWTLPLDVHDRLIERFYREAEAIAREVVRLRHGGLGEELDRKLDRILTSRRWGIPLMLATLALVFWLTIEGANLPSFLLSTLLVDTLHPFLRGWAEGIGLPWWLSGLLFDGMYLATAWVVSVMLPPMAIFFPLFTLLEDFGYLPRVAFNLDPLFRRVGAHGKQALTMCMGFGCNAAGVVSTRIIDSPRERLLAIVTNNFSLCNGRWPTQILMASIFLGTLAPAHWAGLLSAAAVVGVALLGVGFMFFTSWLLSRTLLRGEATVFSLELPPYRPPRLLQTLYTSLVDRTLIVLGRAVTFALPAGAAIWLISNLRVGNESVAGGLVGWLDPAGTAVGLNGVILLAYVVAIPANELVIPTVLMLTALVGGGSGLDAPAGVLLELGLTGTGELLRGAGWTALTGLNLMLFSLLHNPCSTTLYTIYRETGSWRWTAVAALLPLALGFTVTFLVTQLWRLLVVP